MSLHFSPTKRARVMAKTGAICWYCGAEADNIDHVIPLRPSQEAQNWFHIRGIVLGPRRSTEENLIPACIECNVHKANLPLELFRSEESQRLRIKKNQVKFWGEDTQCLSYGNDRESVS